MVSNPVFMLGRAAATNPKFPNIRIMQHNPYVWKQKKATKRWSVG
jgi:hypothetical protein